MKRFLKYGITSGVGLILVLIIISVKNIYGQTNVKDVMHILTDAFFVVGVVIFGYGLLVVATNGGTFDMMTYGITRFFSLFKRDVNKVKYRTFADYRIAKQDRKYSFLYLIIVGGIFIALSCIFLACYYQN